MTAFVKASSSSQPGCRNDGSRRGDTLLNLPCSASFSNGNRWAIRAAVSARADVASKASLMTRSSA